MHGFVLSHGLCIQPAPASVVIYSTVSILMLHASNMLFEDATLRNDHICIHQAMPSDFRSYVTLCQPEPYGILKLKLLRVLPVTQV